MSDETISSEGEATETTDALEAAFEARASESTKSEESTEDATTHAGEAGAEQEESGRDFESIKEALGKSEEHDERKEGAESGRSEATSEDADREGKEESKLESGQEEGSADSTDEKQTEEASEEVKTLEATSGEEKLEIPSDMTFKHKVDGEEVDVSVQELLNNYSGKVAYDRKFQELDINKKEFESDRKVVNDNVNHFFQLASGGHEVEALDFLLERAGSAYGLDRNTFLQGFSEKLEPQLQEWMGMSEGERHTRQLENENSYFKRQRESETQRQSDEKAYTDLETHVSKIQEIHGLDKAQFVEYYDQVVSDPKTIEGLAPTEVLQLVDGYIANTNKFSEAKQVLSEIDSSIAEDSNAVWEFVDTIQQSGMNLSKEELQEVASEVYGIDKIANKLSGRVNKNNSGAKKSSTKKGTVKKAPSNRLEAFTEELLNYQSED